MPTPLKRGKQVKAIIPARSPKILDMIRCRQASEHINISHGSSFQIPLGNQHAFQNTKMTSSVEAPGSPLWLVGLAKAEFALECFPRGHGPEMPTHATW